jgi:hypothetical protein
MIPDHDDPMIAKAWRDISNETPGALLDARIIQAARLQRQRRRIMPWAAALAACLVLAIYAGQMQPAPEPADPASRRQKGATPTLADPEAMRQMMIRQMPGGSEFSEYVSP